MGFLSKLFGLSGKNEKSKESNTGYIQHVSNTRSYGLVTTESVKLTLDSIDKIKKAFVAFDTETTGLSSDYDVIIELGAIRYIDCKAKESFSELVNEGVAVPYDAQVVNHISTEMLQHNGIEPEIAYSRFVSFIDDILHGDTIICAHNASFDLAFLTKTLERLGYSGNIHYVDTLALTRKYIKNLPDYKQETVADYFGIHNRNAHRAVTDAEVCGQLLIKLLDVAEEEIKKKYVKYEGNQPTTEEMETCAVLADIWRRNGCEINNLRVYRTSSKMIDVLHVYNFLKFKVSDHKSYVVIPKDDKPNNADIEPCSKKEGEEDYVRLLFNDPFELFSYEDVFVRIYKEFENNSEEWGGINQFEKEFLCNVNLTPLAEGNIDALLKQAKEHQEEKRQLAIRHKEETMAKEEAKEEKKREKEKRKKEEELKRSELREQQKRINELQQQMLENAEDYSLQTLSTIAELSQVQGKRAIACMDDDHNILKVYESVSQASEAASISPKTIRDVANGKYKHGGGFVWKYVDEMIND